MNGNLHTNSRVYSAGLDCRETDKPVIETLIRSVYRRAYLEQVELCIAGQQGDAQLYKTACIIFWDFGLSETEGMMLLQEYNTRCQPPWNQSYLDYKMNEVFTTSHTGQIKADKKLSLTVQQPGLVIFGTATPERFRRALTVDMIEGGLASRCIIVESDECRRGQKAREGRVTPEMFFGFLKGYMTSWHYTHAKDRIPEAKLQEAENHVIQYAKEHGMKLIFSEMKFRLKTLH
jgi:hypothetical protein